MSQKRSKPDQYQLRFPPGLRERIKAEADANNRSMNAEIIARLEESLSGRFESLDSEYQTNTRRLASMERSLSRLLKQVSDLRDRTEQIASDPERMPPDRVARRAGYDAFWKNPDGPYENPYPLGTEPQRSAFESAYRYVVLRSIRDGNISLIDRFSDLLGDRVEDLKERFGHVGT